MSLEKYNIVCISKKKKKFPNEILKQINKNQNVVKNAFPKNFDNIDAILVYLDGNNSFIFPEIPKKIILIVISHDFRKEQYYKWAFKNAKWMPRICLCNTKSIDLMPKTLTYYRSMLYPLIRMNQNYDSSVIEEIFANYSEINNLISMVIEKGYFLNIYNQPKLNLKKNNIFTEFAKKIINSFTIEKLIKFHQEEIGFNQIFSERKEKNKELDFKSAENIEIWLISSDFDYECKIEIQTLSNANKQDLFQLLIKKMSSKNEFTIRLDNRSLKNIIKIEKKQFTDELVIKTKLNSKGYEIEDLYENLKPKYNNKINNFLKDFLKIDEIWIINNVFYDFSWFMNKIYSMIEQHYIGD